MSVEVEIKLKIEDPEQLIEKLEGLGFIKGEQLLESDTYFTSENHDFVKLGEALRVRQIRNVDTDEMSAVITYKGKKLDDRSMAREELELEIPDAEVGKTLLQRIGFYSVPVLEKKRWYFRRNEMTACGTSSLNSFNFSTLENTSFGVPSITSFPSSMTKIRSASITSSI